MRMSETKERKVINKFQSLLRSGKDFDVESMYEEAGQTVCIVGRSAGRIVKKYYRGIVNQEMIVFVSGLRCSHYQKIKLFSFEFDICERESRLLIRYIKRGKQ